MSLLIRDSVAPLLWGGLPFLGSKGLFKVIIVFLCMSGDILTVHVELLQDVGNGTLNRTISFLHHHIELDAL